MHTNHRNAEIGHAIHKITAELNIPLGHAPTRLGQKPLDTLQIHRRRQLWQPAGLGIGGGKTVEQSTGIGIDQTAAIAHTHRKPQIHGAFLTGDNHNLVARGNHQMTGLPQLAAEFFHRGQGYFQQGFCRALGNTQGE